MKDVWKNATDPILFVEMFHKRFSATNPLRHADDLRIIGNSASYQHGSAFAFYLNP